MSFGLVCDGNAPTEVGHSADGKVILSEMGCDVQWKVIMETKSHCRKWDGTFSWQ
jgi:hypothetical protein